MVVTYRNRIRWSKHTRLHRTPSMSGRTLGVWQSRPGTRIFQF